MIELLSEKDVTKIPQLEDIFNYIKYIFHYIYIYISITNCIQYSFGLTLPYLLWKTLLTILNIYFIIYIYITNCRQYSFGLLDLISAVLML